MEPARPNQQDDKTMIAFFDVETTVPSGSRRRGGGGGGGYYLLEFGAILVCPRRLIEVDNFSTLVRPSDLNAISSLSIRCNGITRDSVSNAPYFVDVANKVFSFLHANLFLPLIHHISWYQSLELVTNNRMPKKMDCRQRSTSKKMDGRR
ncbi:protein NEN1-like [Dendrobium catenatum]|uniref:protein NEN1-like n=1 Tax=Dendrobium catenatum TaxID=906689 RepID=UPI00109FFAD3|nr:protein NEN1-like [Dendrobium catenatum]